MDGAPAAGSGSAAARRASSVLSALVRELFWSKLLDSAEFDFCGKAGVDGDGGATGRLPNAPNDGLFAPGPLFALDGADLCEENPPLNELDLPLERASAEALLPKTSISAIISATLSGFIVIIRSGVKVEISITAYMAPCIGKKRLISP